MVTHATLTRGVAELLTVVARLTALMMPVTMAVAGVHDLEG